MSYSDKLRDPRWQKKRLKIMERDGFQCLHCGESEKTLNVHHSKYAKSRNPWDAEDEHLHTLCEACHEIAEDCLQRVREVIAKGPLKTYWQLFTCDARDANRVGFLKAFGALHDYVEYIDSDRQSLIGMVFEKKEGGGPGSEPSIPEVAKVEAIPVTDGAVRFAAMRAALEASE